jgi:hypothetical protein
MERWQDIRLPRRHRHHRTKRVAEIPSDAVQTTEQVARIAGEITVCRRRRGIVEDPPAVAHIRRRRVQTER